MSEEVQDTRIARGEKQEKGEKDRTPPEGEKKSNPVEICKSNPKTGKYGAILDLGGNCQCFRGETSPHPPIPPENEKEWSLDVRFQS